MEEVFDPARGSSPPGCLLDRVSLNACHSVEDKQHETNEVAVIEIVALEELFDVDSDFHGRDIPSATAGRLRLFVRK
jgi:hypothetical protein